MQSLEFKNYRNLKKEELKNLLEIATKSRESLPEKYDGKIKNKKESRAVMIFNEGKNGMYFGMNEASKALKVYPMQIYVLIARGKRMFLGME